MLRTCRTVSEGVFEGHTSCAEPRSNPYERLRLRWASLGCYFEATRFTASTATSGLSKNMTWPASTLRTLLCGHC